MVLRLLEAPDERARRERVYRLASRGIPATTELSEPARALLAEVLAVQRGGQDAAMARHLDVCDVLLSMAPEEIERRRGGTCCDPASPWGSACEGLTPEEFMSATAELASSGLLALKRAGVAGVFVDFERVEALFRK